MAGAMKTAEAKFEADTAFLTPTQRAKMLLGRMRRIRRMRGRWHAGRRGMRRDGPPPMPEGGNPPPAGQQ